MLEASMQTFDPDQSYSVVHRRLPHWSQAGTITFVTWRTWDSMPRSVIESWQAERARWLEGHGISIGNTNWEERLKRLEPAQVREFQSILSDRWNDHLDECHGDCVLTRPVISIIVSDSLLRFDKDRYEMLDFVVMPNHIHMLVAFPDENALLKQCESWKHFTAGRINKLIGRTGRFWQQDAFDHLVRSSQQFEHLRRYIANNPEKARLRTGEFVHYSANLSGT